MFKIAQPVNEPVRMYEPGSPFRDQLKAELKRVASEKIEIPCRIGGKDVRTGQLKKVVMPHEHGHVLAEFHEAGANEAQQAVQAALKAKPAWEALPWNERSAIFLKAADLVAGPYRNLINATTMLGQSKNAYQAEIDAACEWVDFLRFGVYFYQQILQEQPISSPGMWNQTDHRPLEGFVLAITPFNFTAIAANLPSVPAMLGNTVVWKPSDTQMLTAHYILQILEEAGLPPGVINRISGDGYALGKVLLPMKELAGVNFTGSTETFRSIWKTVGENISNYISYPRLVGETGGKDFVFAHPSANVEEVSTALIRGSFEFQGQKCSAASRAYIPRNLWDQMKDKLVNQTNSLTMGDVRDFRNFVNAVIDNRSFSKISHYLDKAKNTNEAKIIAGGEYDSKVGYFIRPTLILANTPTYETMVTELFGPVLTVYVYEENKLDETLDICDKSTPYSLTGGIFSHDRYALKKMTDRLRHAAGNFYVNDKPTGAVVAQQPFGGSRASGTNDKAGSALNLYRWISPRTIKETFMPAKNYRYPFMEQE